MQDGHHRKVNNQLMVYTVFFLI